ncbi:unnamed protein product [Mesocestoides corti]|uniref:Uncharacterized protein n=1 Tax=Mesocestoides corti TaxID=53468 RepID=A0A0R3UAU3_MESCO|nr:unnamed protein product [Mesocestoides corti]
MRVINAQLSGSDEQTRQWVPLVHIRHAPPILRAPELAIQDHAPPGNLGSPVLVFIHNSGLHPRPTNDTPTPCHSSSTRQHRRWLPQRCFQHPPASHKDHPPPSRKLTQPTNPSQRNHVERHLRTQIKW